MDINIILISILVAVSAGAFAYAFLFPQIEVEKKATTRFRRVQAAETDRVKIRAAKDRVQELSRRRKSMQDSLKDLERKQNERTQKRANRSIHSLIEQAGLKISAQKFHVYSFLGALALTLIALLYGASLIIAGALFIIAAFGAPRWIVRYLVKRRQ